MFEDEIRALIMRARAVSKGSMDPIFDVIFDAEAWLIGSPTTFKGDREEVGLAIKKELLHFIDARETT